MLEYGTNNMGITNAPVYLTLNPSQAAAVVSRKRVHSYGGSSLLRVYKKRELDKETQTNEEKVCPSLAENAPNECLEDDILFARNTDVQGYGAECKQRSMSCRTRKKVFNRAYAFANSLQRSKFPFITFSFIVGVDDRTGIKIFNKFLTTVRKRKRDFQYLWVAERQEKNAETPNNIHFHLICNHELDVHYYNYLWTICQYNEGLVHKKATLSEVHQFYAIHRSINRLLAPLHTKWASGVGGLAAYLTKYITKNKGVFDCAVWHCSRKVSQLCTSTVIDQKTFDEFGDKSKNNFTSRRGKYYEVNDYKSEWAMVRNVLNKSYYDQFLTDMHTVNKWIMRGRVDDVPDVKHRDFVLYHLCGNMDIPEFDNPQFDFETGQVYMEF